MSKTGVHLYSSHLRENYEAEILAPASHMQAPSMTLLVIFKYVS